MSELFPRKEPPIKCERLPSWVTIPFVPRPPVDERIETPGANPLTHVFDTNAVRRLGRLRESSWQNLLAMWKAKRYSTGWIPWVVFEITSSNFIFRGDVVPQSDVEEIVRAVKRFDILAEGDVLPDVDQLFAWSMYKCAGVSGGPSHIHDDEDDLRLRIHVCKHVTRRDQIGRTEAVNGVNYMGFTDGKILWYKPFRSTFAAHAPKAVAVVEEIIKHFKVTKDSSEEEVANAVTPLLLPMIKRQATRFGVPRHVQDAVAKLFEPPADPTKPPGMRTIPDHPFVVAALVETWYYAEFARGRLKRAHLDNDGPDVKIATYMSVA